MSAKTPRSAPKAAFKFNDPYGSSKSAKNGTMKWGPGVPFPYPGGEAWDSIMLADGSSNCISRVCRLLEAETKTIMATQKMAKSVPKIATDFSEFRFPVGKDHAVAGILTQPEPHPASGRDQRIRHANNLFETLH